MTCDIILSLVSYLGFPNRASRAVEVIMIQSFVVGPLGDQMGGDGEGSLRSRRTGDAPNFSRPPPRSVDGQTLLGQKRLDRIARRRLFAWPLKHLT